MGLELHLSCKVKLVPTGTGTVLRKLKAFLKQTIPIEYTILQLLGDRQELRIHF